MSWELVVAFNMVIAVCYVAICSLILIGLVRTRQLRTNKLALATAAIFASCALHHWAHGLHLLIPEGGGGRAGLEATRQTYSGIHNVLIEVLGAGVAITYLGLRRNYKALLNTPAMFDDAVRAATEERLRVTAFTDSLTDIPNRAAYQEHVDGLADDPRPVGVLFLDVDGFKLVNDRYGHDAGDRLLRDVAQRVRASLQPDERIFRIGGDEFLVIAVGAEGDAVDDLHHRVATAITEPFRTRNGFVSVRASIGVSRGQGGSRIGHLVREADVAMYRIKVERRDVQPLAGS